MIFLTKNQSVPKKYPSIVKAIEDASFINKIVSHSILGSGVVNLSKEELESTSRYTLRNEGGIVNGTYKLDFKYVGGEPLIISFGNSENFESVIGRAFNNQFHYLYTGMDETNLVAGDDTNRLIIPANAFFSEAVEEYSTDYYSVLYVNGTPQKYNADTMHSLNVDGNNLEVGFKKIRSGSIYPEPKDVNGNFNSTPISGDTINNWINGFTTTDDDSSEEFFTMSFPNFRINSTPRILVAEVFNTTSSTTEFVHIPKDVAQEGTDLYYRIDDENPEVIYVNQQYFKDLGNNDLTAFTITFYFVSPVEEISPFANGASLSRKYKLPFGNVLPVDTNFKILLHDKSRGTLIDATNLSESLLGDIYNISYESGHLEIFSIEPGLLNENVSVYVADLFYEPPMQLDFVGDMSNIVAAYGTKGTSFIKNVTHENELPDELFLYAYIDSRDVDFSTYSNSDAKLRTVAQLRESDVRFILIDNSNYEIPPSAGLDYGLISLATFTRSGLTYSLSSINNSLATPYQKLLELAKQIKPPGDPFNVVTYEREVSITTTTSKEFRIAHVPANTTKVEVYGWLSEIVASYGGIARDYSAELVLVDTTDSSEQLISTITSSSNSETFFEFVPSNYKTQAFSQKEVPATIGRKYIALKVNVVTTPTDPNYDIDVNLDLYVRMVVE